MTQTTTLLGTIQAHLDSGNVELPPWSEVAMKLRGIIRETDFTLDQVVAEVEKDPALTGEVLKTANSSFFGGLSEITNIKDAAVRLGATELIRLATLVAEKRRYTVSSPELQKYMEPLWQHSHAVAMGSCWLSKKLGYDALTDEAFIAGLLHDVGSLLLIQLLDQVAQENTDLPEITTPLVEELIDSAHTDMGFRLAEHWGLPRIFSEVIRDHHNEELADQSALMNMVCLADKAANQLCIGLEGDDSIVLEASEEAHNLGASDILLAELSIMLEDEAGKS
jgi:HD-like signal output (HDOD) protein